MTKHNKPCVWLSLALMTVTTLPAWSSQSLSEGRGKSGITKTKELSSAVKSNCSSSTAGIMFSGGHQVSTPISDRPSFTLPIHGVTFEFVQIPAGVFLMGSNTGESDERPVQQVRINKSLYMSKTEVTVRQFRAFTETTGYKTEAEKGNWAASYSGVFPIVPGRGLNWHQPGFPQSENDPAVCISWNDAVAFCRWLSKETGGHYRLPSEAEWEYACCAESKGDYPGYADEMGWYRDNSAGRTHPVGQKRPNAWGLYDMHGNAWEWCLDVWHSNYQGAPNDSSPWLTENYLPRIAIRRVLRGGAWCRLAFELGATHRYRGTSDFRSDGTGFRIVSSTTHISEEPKISKPAWQRTNRHALPPTMNQSAADLKLALKKNGANFEFVRIPPGEFLMGSEADRSEKPVHKVRFNYSFDIGRTEVTVRQFRAFIEATGYQTDAEKERWAWTRTGLRDWDPELLICWWNLPFTQSEDEPVTCVSWYDAMEFCKWLSGETGMQIRLPSEAEWEYACRAGTRGEFAGNLDQMAWYRANSGHRTHTVGQKKPNAWGLYDMHGNVWEWCLDMWHENYKGAPIDGSAWTEAKTFEPIMRGGSFINPPWWLRSANHMRNNPGNRFSYNQGFRIVRPFVTTLAPLNIKLPKPMFVGTPQNMRVPNLEKPLGKPRPPFLAPVGTTNVAFEKPVTSSDEEPIIGYIEMITDGNKEAADGSYVELGPFQQRITVDLETECRIYAIVFWHYHKHACVYYDVVVQVADDPDFITNVRTLFNNDIDNSAGFGVGTDMHYTETSEGRLIDAKGVKARYVRLYSNGNTSNDLNHYIEVEVYGKPLE